MPTQPKTNEEIIRQTGTLILDNNPLSIASYLEEKEITRKESTINTMLNEARRSAIQEAIAKLKAKGVVPDNYVGIQDAIALLEKMI